jgi:iron complex transport system substrate-binding protein
MIRAAAVLLAAAVAAGALAAPARSGAAPPQSSSVSAERDRRAPVRRIVSLVPAVTEMLFAIGAGPRVVGVSNYDSFPDAVRLLPRVGALLDPDTERILALRPDLVVTYASQADLRARFERAGIRTFTYRHAGLDGVFDSLREIGEVAGGAAEAGRLAQSLRAGMAAVRSRVAGRPRPRTLLVFERQPKTLRNMYVSGGIGFIHDMLVAAGGANVFADVRAESAQPSHEAVLARAPEVILEVRAAGLLEPRDLDADRAVWKTLPSLPAVRSGRVHFLVGEHMVVPGPRFVQGIEALARTLHPEAFP